MTKRKRCSRCKRTWRLSEFSRKSNGTPVAWCKACHREYDRTYYRRERRRYYRILEGRRLGLRSFFAKLRHGKRCADCGLAFPYFLLELDHVRGRKCFDVAGAQSGHLGLARVVEEIAKCEIVCVNCHRRRTFVRLQLRTGGPAHKRRTGIANAVLRALKKRSRCSDCQRRHPYYVLDMDHLREKDIALSRLVNRAFSLKALKSEIAKCEVVCANCHQIRTFMRRYEAGDPALIELWTALGYAPVGGRRALG